MMPIFRLPEEHVFPDPRFARPDGLLAVGGDLHPGRLLVGYGNGIFPWYSEGLPILWHSPDPRFVLYVDELVIQRSLRKVLRKRPFELTMDQAFTRVLEHCARVPRPGQSGTWITDEMREGYTALHELGFAHSVEVWQKGELVGGLYGVALGGAYFGESMFNLAPNASKIAFAALAVQLREWGYDLMDSQVRTEHLARFGARDISRDRYLQLLEERVTLPGRRGDWAFEESLLDTFFESGGRFPEG